MTDKIVLLTREQILGAQDIASEIVQVPEWGGAVRVRAMTGKQRDTFEESLQVRDKGGKVRTSIVQFRAKLVAWTVVDENGQRLFSVADVQALGEKSAAALTRVAEVASRLSSITADDAEEMIKNSESDQDASSGSI